MGPPAVLKREPRFRKANRFWCWLLQWLGLWAIVMPWRVVYVHPEKWMSEVMRQHERVHYEQMERDGTLVWLLKYAVFFLRFGYRKNPYEREAYRRFGESFWP